MDFAFLPASPSGWALWGTWAGLLSSDLLSLSGLSLKFRFRFLHFVAIPIVGPFSDVLRAPYPFIIRAG